MQSIGTKIRSQRRQLGLTLAELAGRTGISTPYLSLIETGRVPNPPSDEKLKRLEQSLGFPSAELLTQAHLQRTPSDVRAMLGRLLDTRKQGSPNGSPDDAHEFSGVLRELVAKSEHTLAPITANAVPVINRTEDSPDGPFPPKSSDKYVACPGIADKDAFAARVQGDSMTPNYCEGDIVIFSPSLPARNGDDCFIRFTDGQTTFKRIFYEADGDARLPVVRLQPRNEKYRATIVKSDEVRGLYRAAYRYQRVDGE
jgi:SOS-response transcriptional repressor LexA